MSINTKKRADAAITDLSIGLLEKKTKRLVGGIDSLVVKYDFAIVAVVSINKKVKYHHRSYGQSRTRKQAIRLCTKWRKEMIKKHKLTV